MLLPNADPTHVEYVEDYVRIASRQSESIDVALFRDRARGDLVVVAKDKVTGEDVKIPVDGESAAEVYRHPFALRGPPAAADREWRITRGERLRGLGRVARPQSERSALCGLDLPSAPL